MGDEKKPIALLPPPRPSFRPTIQLNWQEALRKASQLPPTANDVGIIIPTPEEYRQATRGFIGPQEDMSKKKRRLRVTAGIGSVSVTKPTQPTHRRYIVKLAGADGKERVGKVITTMDIEEWAKQNGYKILRSFRISTFINPEKEHTELTG